MTPSIISVRPTVEDRRLSRLAALAVGLTLAEAAIPLPVPGVKPGLANIVTLLVFTRFGWRAALGVSLLRVVAGSLLLGSFLTPTFVLSLVGALASLLVLYLLQWSYPRMLGLVGLSVLAAFAHVGAQLALVDAWLLPGVSIMGMLPILLSAAWLTGLVNGLAAWGLLNKHPSSTEAVA